MVFQEHSVCGKVKVALIIHLVFPPKKRDAMQSESASKY